MFLAAWLIPLTAQAEFPVGTVAAFNLASCPAGWSEHNSARGRIIIGAGQGTGLTLRTVSETLGEERHTLVQAEMPSHSHSLSHYKYTSWAYTNLWPDAGSAVRYQFTLTSSTGGDQPHNVIMPSIVLLMCEKT
jgi:microcystin-dependent protein